MQFEGWNPVLFIIAFVVFVAIFWAYLYSQGMMWFQQDSEKRANSWFITFNERDKASGNWFHRFGRWLLVLWFIHLISYQIVTNFIELTPYQLGLFVLVYYLPTELILGITLLVIMWRIHKQPLPRG